MFIVIKIKQEITCIKISLAPRWLSMKKFVIFLIFRNFYQILSLRFSFKIFSKFQSFETTPTVKAPEIISERICQGYLGLLGLQFLRIWSHLLKKPLVERLIFVQCYGHTSFCPKFVQEIFSNLKLLLPFKYDTITFFVQGSSVVCSFPNRKEVVEINKTSWFIKNFLQ